ncbi:MAG: hypothetical protein AAFQ89_04670 [Cyanobacteria bacterium J06626_18]
MPPTTSVSSAPSESVESVVHYRFIPTAYGVMMELWEPKSVTSISEVPYQFRLRHQFQSEHEALAALKHYLTVNSITTAIADWFGDEGINLYETWTISV